MLTTARQACARRLASALPPGLPAESSRQALLRANARSHAQLHTESVIGARVNGRDQSAPAGTKGARGISSGSTVAAPAVAMAEANRSPNDRYMDWLDPSASSGPPIASGQTHQRDRGRSRSGAKPVDAEAEEDIALGARAARQPEWLDSWLRDHDIASLPPSPLPPLETFRGLLPSQPMLALLTLSKLSQAELASIRHGEVRDLIFRVRKVLQENPSIRNRLSEQDMAKPLRILRAVLFALPISKQGDKAFTGGYLQGRILRHFLHLCNVLGASRLARSVFQDRLRYHVDALAEGSEGIMDLQAIALDLASIKAWRTIVGLISPATFPHSLYTADLLAIYMQAHFGIHQGGKVPRIFELYDYLNLKPTAEAFNHLVQAFLEIGDLAMARTIVQEANTSGVSDYASQQLSILRGYRALGMDVDLEKRVLSDIARLGLPLQSRLLNALVRLRLDAGDYDGAEELMARFDLDRWGGGQSNGIKPSMHTAKLAFELQSHRADGARLKEIWDNAKRAEQVDDDVIRLLVTSMIRCGLLKDAIKLLSADRTTRDSSDWSLPHGVRPGPRALNALLGALAQSRGLPGLEQALALFHANKVPPDNVSMKIVVDFVRKSIVHNPNEITMFIRQLRHATRLQPTQSLLDSLISDAVERATRQYTRGRLITEFAMTDKQDTNSPTSGLNLNPKLERSLKGIIESLEQRGSRSGARSLANRLRFDAMTSSEVNGMPSARHVWNSLIARGHKPDESHLVALLRGYADTGHMQQAQDLLVLAEQLGVGITESMLFHLLVGWGKIQQPKKARAAYHHIKRISPNRQPNLRVVTAMIQAESNSRCWHQAAQLCHSELRELNVQLDRKALNVAAQALRAVRDLRGALDLYRSHGPSLDPVARKVVRGIRNYLRKALGLHLPKEVAGLVDEGVSSKRLEKNLRDRVLLSYAQRLLRRDDKVRPLHKRRSMRLNAGLRDRLKAAFVGPRAGSAESPQPRTEERVGRGRTKRGVPGHNLVSKASLSGGSERV
ncbi:hypothetical protein IAU60_003275 [Kwoniella sp. DSM 27419]